MKMEDAVIIGYGVVGKATAKSLDIKNYFDLKENNISFENAAKKHFIFICLPYPTINGKCYTKDIEKLVKKIKLHLSNESILILRSTVTPGTTKKLSQKYEVRIIHYPEFLTESSADFDAQNPDFLIFGSEDKKALKEFSKNFSKFKSPIILTDSITSETLKYAMNTFFATKVIFANQIYDLSQKIGADFETIKETMYLQKWVGKNHLDVFHKGYRGAGGNCLPKDLEAFTTFSKLPLLKLVHNLNTKTLSLNPKTQKKKTNF